MLAGAGCYWLAGAGVGAAVRLGDRGAGLCIDRGFGTSTCREKRYVGDDHPALAPVVLNRQETAPALTSTLPKGEWEANMPGP